MKREQVELLEKALKLSRQQPSGRNQRIYEAVHVGGRTQSEVAAEHRISPRRVSQICQKVAAWAGSPAWLRGEPAGYEHEQADNELARRQCEEVYRRAMRAYSKSEQKLVASKQGTRKGEQWSETSERDQRLDTASLRVALRAVEQRQKVGRRKLPPYGYAERTQVECLQWAVDWLAGLRDDAIRQGTVERGPAKSKEIVEDFLRKLMGAEAAVASADAEEELQPGTMIVGDTVMATPYESATPKRDVEAGGSAGEESAEEAAGLPKAGETPAVHARFGSTEDFEAVAEEADEADAASGFSEATCGDDPAGEAAEGDAEKTPIGRAPTEGGDCRLSLRESTSFRGAKGDTEAQLERARWRLEDRYGMAMSREQIASELNYLDRWKRGLHLLSQPSHDQLEAMLHYCRLARIPLPRSLRRQGTGDRRAG